MSKEKSVFEKFVPDAWPYEYEATISARNLCAGVPANEAVAEAWIRSHIQDTGDTIRSLTAETMADTALALDDAVKEVSDTKTLTVFKRNEIGELCIEGRQIKAAIKEAAMVARATNKLPERWGTTRKGLFGFVSEHIQVPNEKVSLGVTSPDDIEESFVHSRFGASIKRYEVVHDATFSFTVTTDHKFSDKEWAMIWLTGELQGIGANRSQGRGVYSVTGWNLVRSPKK